MTVTITNLVLWKSSGTLLCLQHNYPVPIKSVNGNQNGIKADLMRYTERKQISFFNIFMPLKVFPRPGGVLCITNHKSKGWNVTQSCHLLV